MFNASRILRVILIGMHGIVLTIPFSKQTLFTFQRQNSPFFTAYQTDKHVIKTILLILFWIYIPLKNLVVLNCLNNDFYYSQAESELYKG
jgi:hypothetical protein